MKKDDIMSRNVTAAGDLPMNAKKETLEYWEEKAQSVRDFRAVTHSDLHQRRLEIATIVKYLDHADDVLDVGCGNGFSTAVFSEYCRTIAGIDFSPEMIKRARAENSKEGKINYEVADIRSFRLPRKFSKIVSERCLINILDWNGQKKAIINIAGHLEPNGCLLMMEGVAEGRSYLNKIRVELGLNKLPDVLHNLDFEKKRTDEFLQQYFQIAEYLTFGFYEFVTRIIYPKYIAPNEPEYGSKFHDIALEICEKIPDSLPAFSKLGFWVLKKIAG